MNLKGTATHTCGPFKIQEHVTKTLRVDVCVFGPAMDW